MTGLVLALVLSITPKECDSRPEWCTCRQYVEMQANRCEVDADLLSLGDAAFLRRETRICEAHRLEGVRACELDDGDIYEYGDNAGSDDR